MENTNNNNQNASGMNGQSTPKFQGMPPASGSASQGQSQFPTQSQSSFVPKPQTFAPSFSSTPSSPASAPSTPSATTPQPSAPKFSPFTPASSMTAKSTAPVAGSAFASNASNPSAASVSASSMPNQSPKPNLSSEVNKILNSNDGKGPTQNSKHTMIMAIIGLIILLALGGGAYYWYTNMSTTDESAMTEETGGQSGASSPTSSFPAAVRPAAPAAAPTTTTKPRADVTSQSDRAKIISFIGSNINNLAPIRSRTSYEVTDVTFDGPNRALVSYQDADGYYTAIATVGIDASGNPRVTNFSPLDK